MKTSSCKNDDEKDKEEKVSQSPSPGKAADNKTKILRNQTRHLSFDKDNEEKNAKNAENDIEPFKKEKEKSLIDLNEKSITSNGDPDYQHSLSPTSKVKMRAEIFIHLKQGSIDTSYSIGELLGEGQVSL